MYGNLILEKFKSNSDDEFISLGGLRLFSCSGVEYTHFFGNIWMFEIKLEHHSKSVIKGQGEVHSFKLSIKNGIYERTSIISHEALNLTGEDGLMNTIRHGCMEVMQKRLDEQLGGN